MPSALKGQTPLAGQADRIITALAGQTTRTELASHRASGRARHPCRATAGEVPTRRDRAFAPRSLRAAISFLRCVHRVPAFSPWPDGLTRIRETRQSTLGCRSGEISRHQSATLVARDRFGSDYLGSRAVNIERQPAKLRLHAFRSMFMRVLTGSYRSSPPRPRGGLSNRCTGSQSPGANEGAEG
jgi:hypothetical protein